MDNFLFQKARNLMERADNILVATHENPDCDAISSACFMAEILNLMGKKYLLYCHSRINGQFGFLPHSEKFKNSCEVADFDLVIILDCAGIERAKLEQNNPGRENHRVFIEIDHHPKTKDYADLEIRDSSAASTTEILYFFAKANKIKINKNMANCVLAGIMADTGNFLYPSTSPQSMSICSEMLASGANLPKIIENLCGNKSMASMKAWGKAMSRLKINKRYDFGFTILTDKDMALETAEEEFNGIAGFLSNLSGVKAIMLLRQLPNGKIRGSLRASKDGMDVAKLARALGGGGHVKAAGFTIEGNIAKTENGWKII